MELWLFDDAEAPAPSQRVPMLHRTGDVWHVRLPEDLRGKCYAFRVPTSSGKSSERFDPRQLLLDPYARLIAHRAHREVLLHADEPERFRCGAVAVIAGWSFDWQGVAQPRHAWADTVIYETHVRGFTEHASSNVRHRGQYLGIVEKIPYLKSLGITAIELLPVQAFEVHGVAGDALGLVQYWGYNPIALFAPHPAYASGETLDLPLCEFKTMVRELHRAGIEVILDVVFNHTGEGGSGGPVHSFKGLDNEIYYLLSADGSHYLDYTGCGNTLNCNHPIVRGMILDCLRHWAVECHIDGFRFDLAAVLGRGTDGALLSNPPLLEMIAEDPILRDVKLIAEAWDAGGAFQVGRFGTERWGEWNCHFRDDVRRFWRGDPGWSGRMASRLCGSADLYQRPGGTPLKSVNFVTSHDGFTLYDLVSYSRKHNAANAEDNRDGTNENFSFNHGIEGETADRQVLDERLRQMRNMLATLLLARGVPMLLGGDEFARSQHGNNNAYCQDNAVSWYDWTSIPRHADMIDFVRRVLDLRRRCSVLRADRFYDDQNISWLGSNGGAPDWDGPKNRFGCVVSGRQGLVAMLFNATAEPSEFALPSANEAWRVEIDTAFSSNEQSFYEAHTALAKPSVARVAAHAVLVLTTNVAEGWSAIESLNP